MVAGDLVNTASRIQSVGRARLRARRRADQAGVRGRGRVRRRGRARAEGQGRAGSAVAGAPRRRGSARVAPLDWARSAVRRPRPRAASSSRSSSTPPPTRAARSSCSINGDRRDRQVSAGVGVREVHRRTRRRDLLASRPLPLVWRRGRLLGARGDGEDALRHRRGRGARDRARQASALAVGVPPGRGGARVGRAAPGATCSGSRRAWPATRRTSSPPGGILFERLAEESPTVLVFEDVQWADAGLLDFLAYLLDWSRSHPIFVLALARPEFADKRPTWGAGKRSFSSIYLEPLSSDAMDDLLTGLVPGLPDELRAAHPRACGRRAALRGRDGADAARPRVAHPRRQRLPPDRFGRDAGGAGDPARAGRCPPRRSHRPGAAAGRGRCRPRQDLHEAGPRRLDRRTRDRARAHSRGSAAQGDPLRAGRPTLTRNAASTPSCRTSSSGSPTRRSRCATARPSTSRRPSSCSPRAGTRTNSSKWSRRTTSTRWSPPPTRTTPPRSASAPARCSYARPSGRARSPQTPRRSGRSGAPRR